MITELAHTLEISGSFPLVPWKYSIRRFFRELKILMKNPKLSLVGKKGKSLWPMIVQSLFHTQGEGLRHRNPTIR